MRGSGSNNSQRGYALLSVLVGLAFLGVLAVAVMGIAKDRMHRARNLVEAARAESLADAGFAHAAAHLPAWISDPNWRADGESYILTIAEGTITVTVRDEAGRIDLNSGDEALLFGLMIGLGVEQSEAQARVDAILDWADADDLRRLNGAESADYRAAGLENMPANRPYVFTDELANVKGVPPELAGRLKPHLTVHSRLRGIDPTVASPALLALLPGVAPAKVEGLVVPAGIEPMALGQFLGLDPRHVVASRRQVYSIHAVARTAGGGTYAREAVIRLLRDPARSYAVLSWQKGAP